MVLNAGWYIGWCRVQEISIVKNVVMIKFGSKYFEVIGSNDQYKYDICICAMHITGPICISILLFVYRIEIEIRTQKYKT